MNEQEKREKVISDLEEQITWIRDNDFHKFPGWGHAVLAMRDAVALLKAQATRVLTLDEYKAITEQPLENRVPVWLEWRGASGRWTIPNRAYELYGQSWRCWTEKPTDEQRRETPWQ